MATYDYDYAIGASVVALVNVESLATYFPPPTGMTYQPFSVIREAISGSTYGDGFPTCVWQFDYLTKAMLDTLLGYIGATKQSNRVYITTRAQDGTYSTYYAIMHRPVVEEGMSWAIGGWRDVVIKFTRLEIQV